jgi:hypothetical protein
VTSYDALPATIDPACPDLRGPAAAAGLTTAEADLLAARNDQLNTILVAGARKYGFGVARPHLSPLCAPGSTETVDGSTGPDLQGLADPFPFHPTGTGSLRTAAAVARLITPDPDGN